MKYPPACTQSIRYSGATSFSVAPVVLMRTNPWMPAVEGKIYPSHRQNSGMASFGHEMPEMNSRMSEVKTNTIIGASRVCMNPDIVMAKIAANK